MTATMQQTLHHTHHLHVKMLEVSYFFNLLHLEDAEVRFGGRALSSQLAGL